MAKPNDWSKAIATKAAASAENSERQASWQTYWEEFFTFASAQGVPLVNRVAAKEGWLRTEQLKSGDPNAAAWLHCAPDRLRAIIWLQGVNRLALFDQLYAHHDAFEESVSSPVHWERMEHRKSSMITLEAMLADDPSLNEVSAQFRWFVDSSSQLRAAVRPFI